MAENFRDAMIRTGCFKSGSIGSEKWRVLTPQTPPVSAPLVRGTKMAHFFPTDEGGQALTTKHYHIDGPQKISRK